MSNWPNPQRHTWNTAGNLTPLRDATLVHLTAKDSNGLELPAATSDDPGKRALDTITTDRRSCAGWNPQGRPT